MIIDSIPSQKLTSFFQGNYGSVLCFALGPLRNLMEATYFLTLKNEHTGKVLLIIKPMHSPYIKNPCYKKSSKRTNKTKNIFKHFMPGYGRARFCVYTIAILAPSRIMLCLSLLPFIVVTLSQILVVYMSTLLKDVCLVRSGYKMKQS